MRLSQDKWPALQDPVFNDVAYSELSKTPCSETHVLTTVVHIATLTLEQIMNCQGFSNLNRLLCVTAQVLHFVEKVRDRPLGFLSVQYHSVLLEAAELS